MMMAFLVALMSVAAVCAQTTATQQCKKQTCAAQKCEKVDKECKEAVQKCDKAKQKCDQAIQKCDKSFSYIFSLKVFLTVLCQKK